MASDDPRRDPESPASRPTVASRRDRSGLEGGPGEFRTDRPSPMTAGRRPLIDAKAAPQLIWCASAAGTIESYSPR